MTVSKKQRLTGSSVENSPPKDSINAKIPKPTRIIISGIHQTVSNNPITLAKQIQGAKPKASILSIKVLRNKDIEIIADDNSVKYLLEPWHQNSSLGNPKPKQITIQNPKLYSAVICGINPEVEEKEIKTELLDQGYQPVFVKRLISKATSNPTWKVKVAFQDIHDQTDLIQNKLTLGYTSHRVEPYIESPKIIQCYKCQGFGHQYQNCQKETKCLRCGGPHRVKDCPKEKNENCCANCGGDHVALYQGCPNS